MRQSAGFQPEWGNLIPALRFASTAVIVLVALAVGATAGTGIVLSLTDPATVGEFAVARTLARPPVGQQSPVSPVQTPQSEPEARSEDRPAKLPAGSGRDDNVAASESMAGPIVELPANIVTARTELPAAPSASPSRNPDAAKLPASAPVRQKANRSQRSSIVAARTDSSEPPSAAPAGHADDRKPTATATPRKKATASHRASMRYPSSGEQHYGWY
jgi:hypothetical protein